MAETLTACQHLYARAEKEQSPRGLAGYQTLFYTHPDLTEDQAVALEPRLFYYPTETSPPKRAFFAAPGSGRLVVSNIVRLPTRDSGGRLIGLAHSLVFAPDAFLRAGSNPFCALDGFAFARTLEQALAAGDFARADVPAAVVPSPPETVATAIALADAWPPEELRKLVFLILRAGKLAQEQMALALVGPPPAIEEVLRVAHLIVPAACCGQCSFDTHFVDNHDIPCNLASSYYWAVGLPNRPTSDRFLVVDAAGRHIEYDARWKPANAFERWLEEQLAQRQWQQLAQHKDQAYALAQMLEGIPDQRTLAAVPGELASAVLPKDPGRLAAYTAGRLARQLPAPVAERLAGSVIAQMPPPELLAALRTGFELPFLLEILWQTYEAASFQRPDAEELNALCKVVGRQPHDRLRLLAAAWTAHPEALQAALDHVTDEQYREFVPAALRGRACDPLLLMDPRRVGLFLAAYLAASPRAVPLPALVAALLYARAEAYLGAVAGLLRHEPIENLDRIRAAISTTPGVPQIFLSSLAVAEQKAFDDLGMLARLSRGLHGRKPRKGR